MRPFVCFLLACCWCAITLPAAAQCGPGGCNVGGGMMGGWYSTPTASSYEYSAPVVRTSIGSSISSTGSAGYSVGSDGSVLAPNGDRVKSLGGVEIVAKQWAATARQSTDTKANSAGGCDCAPTLAIMKAQLDRIESKLDRVTPYGDNEKQSQAIPKADAAVARLESIQARQHRESLALR